MDKEQALEVLGLTPISSADDIIDAYNSKLSQLAAPNEAVRAELETIKATLNEAKVTLLQSDPENQHSDFGQTETDYPSDAGLGQGSDESITIGSILANRYEIKAFINEDSLALVYRAFDSNRHQDVAIRIMQPHLMQTNTACEQFLEEAWLSSQLSHPNIVAVFDMQQQDGLCFLTMELLKSQSLRTLMESRKLAGQQFTLDDVIEILTPICDALEYSHQIMTHRDIRPENIFLTSDGQYKLIGFGIARIMSASQRTQTGAAYYLAPEQIKEAKTIDGRADQYALAVLAYELISGTVPVGAIEPLNKLVKDINKEVSATIQQALSPKPENRFASLPEFLAGLQEHGQEGGMILSLLPSKKLTGFAIVIIAILALAGLSTSGGPGDLWQAIKPVDTALIAQQNAEADRLQMEEKQLKDKQIQKDKLAQQRAEAAGLESEIINYKQRLKNGRAQLAIGVRGAERDDNAQSGSLQHWQTLTENQLFNGEKISELEGQLSMAQSLLQQDSKTSLGQAQIVLMSVRNGYQTLWNDFVAAESIQIAGTTAEQHRETWQQLKKRDQLRDNEQASAANIAWLKGRDQTLAGHFAVANASFGKASVAYQVVIETAQELAKQRLMATLNRADWLRLKKQNRLVDSQQAKSANANWAKGQDQIQALDFAAAITNLEQANADYRALIKLSQQLAQQQTQAANNRTTWLQLKNQGQLGDNRLAQTANKHWAEAVEYSRTGNLTAANTSFARANTDYQAVIEPAKAIASARELTIKASKKWQMRQASYDLESPPSVAQAVQSEIDAKNSQTAGELSQSKLHWQQAEQYWTSATESTSNQVALIESQRAEARKAEQARLATIAANEAKVAKLEAARLAVIAAEAEQKRIAGLIKQATPKMIPIPSGNFQMGDLSGEGYANEKPVHPVTVQAFEMSEAEVTFAQWDACVSAGGCNHNPSDRGWGRDNRPVINVSYHDITQEFIPWLNEATGSQYALSSEAQWEYAARAGSSTKYSWGDNINCTNAQYGNYDGYCDSDRTVAVKSFAANAYGLYDMHGNVREWVADCWNDSYAGAPSDGYARQNGDCSRRGLRGSAWYDVPNLLRSAFRFNYAVDRRGINSGFRLVLNNS